MVQRAGLNGNEFDGVFFTESLPSPGMQVLTTINVTRNRQNSNLIEVKQLMAASAKAAGANAVLGFRYGQRAHKWWQQAFTFKWDSESWFGEGVAVVLDRD